MKKLRITAVSAALCMTFGLFGCSEDAPEKEQSSQNTIPTNAVSSEPVPQEVVEPFISYFKGFTENDAELVFRATTPDAYIESLKETKNYEGSIEEIASNIEATYKMWTENYGENVVASYDSEVSNKVLTQKQLDLAELCIEYYYYGIEPEIDVTEGYEVTFSYTIKGDTSSTTAEETACFVKIADQWVMITSPASALNSYDGARDPAEESGQSAEGDQ